MRDNRKRVLFDIEVEQAADRVFALKMLDVPPFVRSCLNCVHYEPDYVTQSFYDYYEQDWNPPECGKVAGRGNLKSFPFANTKCENVQNKNI